MSEQPTMTDEQWDALRARNLNAARDEAEARALKTRRTHYVCRIDYAEFIAVCADEYEGWGYTRRHCSEVVDTYWAEDDFEDR